MAESSSVDGFNVDRDASSDSDIDNKDDGHLHTPAKERRRRTFLFYSPSSSRPSRKKKKQATRSDNVSWRFSLHMLMLLLSTGQVILANLRDALYTRAMQSGFKYFFLPSSASATTTLYTFNETLVAAQRVSDNFWSASAESVAMVGYLNAAEVRRRRVRLRVVKFYL